MRPQLTYLPLLVTSLALAAGCGDSESPSGLALGNQEIVASTGSPGPVISLWSNILGTWQSGEPSGAREAFAGAGVYFAWSAEPGKSGAEIVGFSYAVDDTSEWTPFSPLSTEFPEQPPKGPEVLWFPEPGVHAFYVRALDEADNVTVLAAPLLVFAGPGFCNPDERYVLVVLDTDPDALVTAGIWPPDFADIERSLVEGWLAGYDYVIHETGGTLAPAVSLLSCASTTFWLHGTDVAAGDGSVLGTSHSVGPRVLPSYVAAGGNLLLCGLRPSEALRWFESTGGGPPVRQDYPVDFDATTQSDDWVPHWAATELAVAEVERSIGASLTGPARLPRIVTATSAITGGANPYPDLPWDPAHWPRRTRGFGYFDYGVVPRDDGEIIYELNDTSVPLAVRRLRSPGVEGNTVFVGFHPYFVDESAFGDFVAAVLSDFGETGSLAGGAGIARDRPNAGR